MSLLTSRDSSCLPLELSFPSLGAISRSCGQGHSKNVCMDALQVAVRLLQRGLNVQLVVHQQL